MHWFIYLFGIFWIVIGIWGLTSTKKMTLAITNFIRNVKRQNLALIQLILGSLLLISASSAREAWFILVIGIMACLKGAASILISDQKLKATIDWWAAAPEIVQKGQAAAILILGILIFFIV